jgi:hypothetical protein
MTTTYPDQLTFDLADNKHTRAVLDAARALQLPFEVDGPTKHIVVIVASARTAYEFGFRTQVLLGRRRRR